MQNSWHTEEEDSLKYYIRIRIETGDLTPDSAFLIEYYPTNEDDEWRTELLDDLLKEAEIRNLDQDEKELLDVICSS